MQMDSPNLLRASLKLSWGCGPRQPLPRLQLASTVTAFAVESCLICQWLCQWLHLSDHDLIPKAPRVSKSYHLHVLMRQQILEK